MAKTYSCLLVGVDVHVIEIETVLGSGFSGLNILGLPTDATRDMRERVRSALESVGIPIPARRVVVNISPNESIKLSRTPLSQLDFAVAASIIRAFFQDSKEKHFFFEPTQEFLAGELSLSGQLKAISNSLVYESLSHRMGPGRIFCLPAQEHLPNINFEFFSTLQQWLNARKKIEKKVETNSLQNLSVLQNEKEDLVLEKKRKEACDTFHILCKNPKILTAILIAAAGKHHLILAGEPGIGKSFAVKKLPAFLPPLNEKQKFEVKLIHSNASINEMPFRSPHHSTTAAAIVGGASLKPGEVTLAHNGILFLDELAEFPRNSLEALREPLDSKYMTLSRAQGNIVYPADFQLFATTNPCPCGYLFSRKKPCRCNPTESKKYLQKISGPLLDRFCLQLWANSMDDENSEDIFTKELAKIQKNNEHEKFFQHFFRIQQEISQDVQINDSNRKIDCGFSFRGKEKIEKIAFTFEKLFPNLVGEKNFYEDILSYRILGEMLCRNY